MRNHLDLVFSLKEYKRRLDHLLSEMTKAGISHLLVTEPDNLAYLTGHETSGYGTFQGIIIGQDGSCFSLSRILEESNFISRTWVTETHSYQDFQKPQHVLADLLKSKKIGSLAIELDGVFLPRTVEKFLRENLEVKNGSGLVEKGRIVKSTEEIDLMKKIAAITEKSMIAGIEITREGIGENEIAAEIHRAMYRNGGEYPSVPPYISSGPRTMIGHATWTTRKINKEECVFLELAGTLKRYHTAMMRTVYVGNRPPQEFREGEKIVRGHIQILKEKMRPGVPAGEIDTLTRDQTALEKIGATRISRTGYSLGISFAPSWDEGHVLSLVEGERTPLSENMVFHLIPWLQFPKLGMVMTLSETVRITPNGAESFFKLPVEVTYKN